MSFYKNAPYRLQHSGSPTLYGIGELQRDSVTSSLHEETVRSCSLDLDQLPNTSTSEICEVRVNRNSMTRFYNLSQNLCLRVESCLQIRIHLELCIDQYPQCVSLWMFNGVKLLVVISLIIQSAKANKSFNIFYKMRCSSMGYLKITNWIPSQGIGLVFKALRVAKMKHC